MCRITKQDYIGMKGKRPVQVGLAAVFDPGQHIQAACILNIGASYVADSDSASGFGLGKGIMKHDICFRCSRRIAEIYP